MRKATAQKIIKSPTSNTLGSFFAGNLILLRVPAGTALRSCAEAIHGLQKKGYDGVYITLFSTYPEISEVFEHAGVDLKRLTFIDGATEMQGAQKHPGVIYVPSPFFTNDIHAKTLQAVMSLRGKKKFVFLDSLTAVLLYNTFEQTTNFMLTLAENLKSVGPGFVVSVAIGPTNPEMTHTLKNLITRVVDLR